MFIQPLCKRTDRALKEEQDSSRICFGNAEVDGHYSIHTRTSMKCGKVYDKQMRNKKDLEGCDTLKSDSDYCNF